MMGERQVQQDAMFYEFSLERLDGTIALAGPNAVLTDANGATLNGGSIQGFGKVNAGLTGTGMIMASGGTLELQTAIGNSSGPIFQIADGLSNILQVDGTVGTGNSFAFLGPNGDLGLGTDAGFNNIVSGLNVGVAGAKTNFVDIEGHTVTIQTVTGGGTTSGSVTLSDGAVLQLTGLNSTAWFANTVSDGAGGTEIFVSDVCFCRGTLILTDEGEVAVEALAVGDRVRTLSGESKPIVWIGFGRDLVTRANRLARPIVVRRGALADDVPRRDLYLTHGHALYLEGVLIPVEHLVNHRSILWDDTARVVEYYHIELADHDVVLAEGAPAESYYDASNRAQFLNTREGSEAGAKKPTYAPVLNGGDVVDNAWARLCERAGGQIECDTTDDPDLHLVVDGERLPPDGPRDPGCGRPGGGRMAVRGWWTPPGVAAPSGIR